MQSQLAAIFLIVTLSLVSISPISYAQSAADKQEKKVQKVKEKIAKLGTGPDTDVRVKLYSGTSHRGFIRQVNESDLVLVNRAGKDVTVNYSDIDSIGGRNLSTGAKIAIGIGIGVGLTILTLYLIWIGED